MSSGQRQPIEAGEDGFQTEAAAWLCSILLALLEAGHATPSSE